ncbi:MAG: autotransporter-associated beta strand repeat-containing protein [Kiritimatiellia bacterium]
MTGGNAKRGLLAGGMVLAGLLPVLSAQREWNGGGEDDNLSTPANWVGGTAPASGDILVFRGNVRTSPVNDYDPETTVFETLVFSNDCQTAERSAPFTLTGNKMVLTGGTSFAFGQKNYAIFVANVPGSGQELTDTLDLEISLPDNSKNSSRIGGFATYRHHLVFKKAVTANGGKLYAADQTRGNMTFEAPVSGFSQVFRPNGYGMTWLKSPDNVFTVANPGHCLREGSLRVDSQAAAGGTGVSLMLGQDQYETPGKFLVHAAEDTLFTGSLTIQGPNYRTTAGELNNEVAGTTATFTGDMTAVTGSSSYSGSDGLGTGATFAGAGNGVFSGDILTPQVWVYKTGTGVWTLAGQSAATGAVTVSAGTLLVNGDYARAERSQVAAGARLGGTGRLGDVTFAGGSALGATNVMGGTALQTEALVLSGTVNVDLLDGILPKEGTYTVLSFTSRSGTGFFMLGDGWPEGTSVSLGETALTVTVPTGTLTWTGDASSAWDFTSANWAYDQLYQDGNAVTFGDAGRQTAVTIAQEVRPSLVSVTGAQDYTLTGATIAGSGGLVKAGTGTLVLANENAYTGDTSVNAGALRLEGTLANSTVRISASAAFTNAVSGRITGRGALVSTGTVELGGTNDFTGGLVLGGLSVVTNPRALGNGDVTFEGAQKIRLGGGAEGVGRGRTLSVDWANGSESHAVEVANGEFRWLGNVIVRNYMLYVRCLSSASLVFGEPGCATTVAAEGFSAGQRGFYLREGGVARFYSRLDLGNAFFHQTDYNKTYFHAPGNRWSRLTMQVGRVCCCTNDALAPATVEMGQTYGAHSFHPVLDLGGFDQTITALVMAESIDTSTQTVTSDAPATLTVSNEVDTTTLRMQCRIAGAITLRKKGAGTWTFGAQNLSTGNVEVVEGTLKLTADDTLPAGTESMLTIAPGANIVLDEGVSASVAYATCGGRALKAGVYCGAGGTGTRLDAFIGAGGGSLTVTRGVNGFMIIVR